MQGLGDSTVWEKVIQAISLNSPSKLWTFKIASYLSLSPASSGTSEAAILSKCMIEFKNQHDCLLWGGSYFPIGEI